MTSPLRHEPRPPRRRRDAVPLAWYGAFLRRHRLLLVAATLVGLVAGLAVVKARGTVYTATVEVIAARSPIGIAPQTSTTPVIPSTVDTEAQLLRSDPVLAATARALGHGTTVADVRRALAVSVPEFTRVLVVDYHAHNAQTARAGATEVARQYVALRGQIERTERDRQVAKLLTYTDALQRNLASGRGQGSVTVGFVRTALRKVIRQLQDLRSAPIDAGELTAPQATPVASESPNASVPVTAGALLGVLAAVLIGLLSDARHRIVTVQDAIAACPAEIVTTARLRRHQPVHDRRLRNEVLVGWPSGACVAVTGPDRTTERAVADGLASALAEVVDGVWIVQGNVAARPPGVTRLHSGRPQRTWTVVTDTIGDPHGDEFLTGPRVDLVVIPVVLGRTTTRQLLRAYDRRHDARAPVALVVLDRRGRFGLGRRRAAAADAISVPA